MSPVGAAAFLEKMSVDSRHGMDLMEGRMEGRNDDFEWK